MESHPRVIGSNVFSDCGLLFVPDENGFVIIGGVLYAYYGDSTNVTIPDGVVRIDDYVFEDCDFIKNISIPDSVVSIGGCAFSLYAPCIYEEGSLFLVDGWVVSCWDPREEEANCLKNHYGIRGVADGTFCDGDDWSSACDLVFNEGVVGIGNSSFIWGNYWGSVTLPESLLCIGNYAFYGTHIESVVIPDGVISIGFKAFWSDELKYVSIHESLKEQVLSGDVFDLDNLDKIQIVWRFDYEYFVSNGCVTITGIPKTVSGAITIPSTLEGLPVTSIGEYAFSGCSSLTSITIPDSVTSIGASAFSGCSSLTSVTIPDSVTSIGDSAFECCSSLTSVTIPDSVTSIGESAFSYCYSLTSVTIPDSVTSIGSYAFSGCSSLLSVTIGDSVTSIESGVFSECSSLTSVTISDSVTSIGFGAFGDCNKALYDRETISGVMLVDGWVVGYDDTLSGDLDLTGIRGIAEGAFIGCETLADNNGFVIVEGVLYDYLGDGGDLVIPDSVTSIGNEAFYDCSSLTSITIPDSVTSIGDSAFECCSSLTSVTIPDNVTSIGDYAFYYCESLTSVTIPDSVTSIGDYAFNGCSSLTSVTIPDSVTSIGEGAFSDCSSLMSFNVSEDNLYYSSKNGLLLSKDGKKVICGVNGDVTIPDSVTSIGDWAFEGCSSLTSVTIPGSVTSIGNETFSLCSSLTSVTIPDSVTSIGDCAFSYCSSLTSVTIPVSVTSIGDCVFDSCSSLTSVTIPDSVTSIGEGAFSGCSSLTSVTIPDSVTSIGDYTFIYCEDLASAKVPLALKEQVENEYVFYGCSNDLVVEYYCVANFDANGGESLDETKRYVTVGTRIGSLSEPTREGCEFLGWFTAAEGGSQVTADIVVTGDMTIYAHWEKLNPIPVIDPDWGYVVTELGKNKNEVAIVFTNHIETAMTWTVPVNLENVQFLVVGGGGGGGADNYVHDARQGGAGGGGGGVIAGTIAKLDKESKISITVGGGGSGGKASNTNNGKYGAGTQGGNSAINIDNTDIVVANGGGCDMGADTLVGFTDGQNGGSGGSGGGGRPNKLGGVANPGTVVENYLISYQKYGNNGGNGCTVVYDTYGYGAAGGGGGATAPGGNGTKGDIYKGGNGGEGLSSDITGVMTVYGSGGGGSSTWGEAGIGGEGAGDGVYAGNGKSGLANQGGGGGGGSRKFNGGAGGSGIVVLRFVITNVSSLNEVFPEVSDDSEVVAALDGSADAKLAENIASAADYAAFREWALNLEDVAPKEVKASPNAWLSYALNTDKLIIAAPKEGDVVIDTFEIAATEGAFEFTVKIDGVEVGDNALEANLKKVFGIEGAETLASGGAGFSSDNVEINAVVTVNGNVKFTVTPKMGNGEKPKSFFFRVKMK